MFKSTRLKADMSGVFSVYPEKKLFSSEFWTILFGLLTEDPVIDDVTANSTLSITTLFIAVKWTRANVFASTQICRQCFFQ